MSIEQALEAPVVKQKAEGIDFAEIKSRLLSYWNTQTGKASIIGFILMTLAAWPITSKTPNAWFDADSYYQHGALIPLALLYIFALNQPNWLKDKAKPTMLPLALLAVILYLMYGTTRQVFLMGTGILYIGGLFTLAWTFAGFKWAARLIPYLFFLSLGLPMWTRIIELTTSPWQILSTKIAEKFLLFTGQNPFRESPTVLMLDNFNLNIEVACAGMKLTLTMISMAVFIFLVAKLSWWKNLIILALAIPLAIIMNGLRIGIIGLIGNNMGHEAGMWMHDYGSYGIVALAVWMMYKIAVLFGWKV